MAKPTTKNKTPFEKMRELTRRLVAVPKREIKPRQPKKAQRKRGRS